MVRRFFSLRTMNNRISRMFGFSNPQNLQRLRGNVAPLHSDIIVCAPQQNEYYSFVDIEDRIINNVSIINFNKEFERICTDQQLGNEDTRKNILNKIVIKMKTEFPDVLNNTYTKHEHFLVHCVSYLGCWFAFELLVQHGAQISCITTTGETILHSLLEGVCDEQISEDQAVDFLQHLHENRLLSKQMDEKLNIDEQNVKGETVAHLAAIKHLNKIFQSLLNIGANIDVECGGETARSRIRISSKIYEIQSKQPENMYSFLSIFKHHKSEIEILSKIDKILKNNLRFGYLRKKLFAGAIEHGYYHVVKLMLNEDIKVNDLLSIGGSIGVIPLFLAASHGYKKIVELLLKKGADINIRHLKTYNTVFHECADLPQPSTQCFRILLQHAADTNQLHLINARDFHENTPLHLAGLRNNEEIIQLLLDYKADAFLKNMNETPAFSYIDRAHIERHLDTYIDYVTDESDNNLKSDNDDSEDDENEESKKGRKTRYLLRFDFTFLFSNSTNKMKKTKITPNEYAANPTARLQDETSFVNNEAKSENYNDDDLSSSSDEGIYSNHDEKLHKRRKKKIHSTEIKSLESEMKILSLISKYENHRKLLLHPLIKCFLYLKWTRLSWIYYLNLSVYIAFTVFISNYIYDRVLPPSHFKNLNISEYLRESENWKIKSWNSNTNIYDKVIQWCTLSTLIIFAAREFIQICLSFKIYIREWTNYLDWTIIINTIVLLFVPLRHFHFYVAASSLILLSYFDLLLLIGTIPAVTNYMKMFLCVSRRFTLFFMYFSILIVAFAGSFYIMFQKCKKFVNCSTNEIFSSGFIPSIFKTIMMMVGEYEYSDLKIFDVSQVTQLIFILFVFFISIVLLNLAVGLAVSDTEKIIQRADIDYCLAQIKIFDDVEHVFFTNKDKIDQSKQTFYCNHNSWLATSFKINVLNENADKKCILTLGDKGKLSPEIVKNSTHRNIPNNHYSRQIKKLANDAWIKKAIATDVQNMKNNCNKLSKKNKYKITEVIHEMKAIRKELTSLSNQLLHVSHQ